MAAETQYASTDRQLQADADGARQFNMQNPGF